MKILKIANKEYPFIISAASAKEYFTKGEAVNGSMSENIDLQLELIYSGLKDGSLSKTWIQRNITDRLPGKKHIERMVTIDEMNEAISMIFPAVKGEPDSEKK